MIVFVMNRPALAISVIVMLLILCGCGGGEGRHEGMTVSVITPVQDSLVREISGGSCTVNTLMPDGADPETFDPLISDMASLGKSSLLFTTGSLPFEANLSRQLSSNFPELKSVDTAKAIELLKGTHPGADPHYWVSAPNMARLARYMAAAMSDADPGNRNVYEANAARMAERYTDLHRELSDSLAPLRGHAFMIGHPSLSYFARDYGLVQLPLESEGKELTSRDMAERIRRAASLHPGVYFYERNEDPERAASIARMVGARAVPLPAESMPVDQQLRIIADELLSGE